MNDNDQIVPRNQISAIDWGDMHHRLKNVMGQTGCDWTSTEIKNEELLKARTKALAMKPEDEEDEDSIEVVKFVLSNEEYAIESMYVRQVLPLNNLTPLPSTPSFVLGIINVHGRIVSVVDMRKLLDIPVTELTELNRVIIIYNDYMEFGILADGILEVESVKLKDIQSPPPVLRGNRTEYIKGVTIERLVVLDAQVILSDKRNIVHEEVKIISG